VGEFEELASERGDCGCGFERHFEILESILVRVQEEGSMKLKL
jgi:hypothetical protein